MLLILLIVVLIVAGFVQFVREDREAWLQADDESRRRRMRPLTKIAVVCGLFIAAVYGCVSVVFPKYHVRFRLTVEVKDGDQIRTGSSVIEVDHTLQPDGIAQGPNPFRPVVGFAPTVDLGAKGLLFVTFLNASRWPQQIIERNTPVSCGLYDIACLPFAAYAKPGSLGVGPSFDSQKAALDQLLRQSGPRDVPFVNLPQLVRLLDINDKTTMTIVSPSDLSASFGPGVELSRVVLELTNSAITPKPQIWPQWPKDNLENAGFED
jgi:hypothetical protein